MIAELFLSWMFMWAPPEGDVVEGPASEEPNGEDGGEDAGEPSGEEPGGEEPGGGEPGGEEPSGEAPSGEDPSSSGTREVDAIVEAAAQGAKDRAWLERNHQDIPEYVRHLDAMADVADQLDTCASAIRAELRMALALAYLKHEGSCTDTGEIGEGEGEGEDQDAASAPAKLPMPVLECFEASSPGDCANRLLEEVAAFADAGPGGTAAPFASAFGCPHAVAEMSVEQMFGTCMVEQYDAAVDRWSSGGQDTGTKETKVWPVPRWATIGGTSLGAAMVITGAVLLGIDGKCPGGYDPVTEVDQCPSVYNTNVSGGVLVGVGAVVMVGMGTVLAITEIQRKKAGNDRPTAMRRRLERAQALTGLRLTVPRL